MVVAAVGPGETSMVERAAEGAGIEVLVVDDHRSFAEALALAVSLEPDLRCQPPVATAEEALARVEVSCPDVVLLDVLLPGMDGVAAIPEVRARCPDARIVVLTADPRGETFIDAVDAGADGFLSKEVPFDRVLDAIRHADHDLAADPVWLQQALEHARSRASRPPVALTDREYEILVLLAEGLAVKQVARRLDMSVHTCRGHVASLHRKLGVHSQLAAVVVAARMGLLPNLQGPTTEL